MTSTQEPNTIAPQSVSSLYFLAKMENKTNRSKIQDISGTETSNVCFENISFSSLESGLSFDSGDSEINLD